MPTEELEQALRAAQWGDAEKDDIEVITRVLKLPRAAVVRALFLARQLDRRVTVEDEIPSDVLASLRILADEANARMRVRYAMEEGAMCLARPQDLIKDPAHICRGCPISIRCTAENISSPERCYREGVVTRFEEHPGKAYSLRRAGGHGQHKISVTPLRMQKNRVTVKAEHPAGTYVLDATDLR